MSDEISRARALWEQAVPFDDGHDTPCMYLPHRPLKNGYVWVGINGRRRPAHTAIHEALVGAIPAGHEPDHLCRNRACVNPWHIEVVTQRENKLRGNGAPALYARRTLCARGHRLVVGPLKRHCPTCDADRKTRWRERNRARWLVQHRKNQAAYLKRKKERADVGSI